MVGSKQHKKQQKRKCSEKESPSKKSKHKHVLSLASRLKKLRGTAESTPLPPEWSLQSSSSYRFLTPSDGNDFQSCRTECYRGFCWESPEELPDSLHSNFDRAFDALHEAGLFLYDTVQPGGKRLSRTFVTRTVIGKPGSTYRYLGLRLFSHPWGGDNAGGDNVQSLVSWGYTQECASALVTIGTLNRDLKQRTHSMMDKEIAPHVELVGSADYSLTLINRMEPTSLKKDLKQEKEYGMGKTSVSWHKDSGLADFSSIAVYHSLREANESCSATKIGIPWKMAVRIANHETKTPPLCLPLPSGTLYYLLDDFNHKHEHIVVAGSNQLRYSSTHRVAREGRGTWQYIRDKCNDMLDNKASHSKEESLSERRKRLVKETRAQQQLLDEIEFEWLRQWYIQGQLHATLHPYWHKPMEQLEGWFQEFERRTLRTIEKLRASSENNETFGKRQNSLVTEDLFDVMIEAMERRQKARAIWLERLDDPIFETMSEREKPFTSPVLDRVSYYDASQLPENLMPLVADLRTLRKRFVKHAQNGKGEKSKSAHSNLTKREKKTIASNWESMKASFSKK